VLLVAYPYAIYPVLLFAFNRIAGRRIPAPMAAHTPSLTVVLPVHNESRKLAARIRNILEQDYPPELLQLVVVGDGCTDDSLEVARAAGGARVETVALSTRSGKAAGLNAALVRARGEIIVFTDAGIQFDAGCLRVLAGHFANPAVGCVSGEDYLTSGGGEGVYGRLELLLRREEARLHSIAGASGCLYAQRRSLVREFPAGMAPDFLSVLNTVFAGQRAICEPGARGSMTATARNSEEFKRKTRTFLRGLTALFANGRLLNPFRFPAFNFVLWSHKLLRWFAPLPLVSALICAWLLRDQALYAWLFAAQALGYAIALAGILMPESVGRNPLVRIAAFLVLVNLAAAAAVGLWIAGVRQEIWQPTRRPM
jgi:cellulose synthase/poly-beta-1,6-N-acetylglucosamine synthase-like glycosyltransferase